MILFYIRKRLSARTFPYIYSVYKYQLRVSYFYRIRDAIKKTNISWIGKLSLSPLTIEIVNIYIVNIGKFSYSPTYHCNREKAGKLVTPPTNSNFVKTHQPICTYCVCTMISGKALFMFV